MEVLYEKDVQITEYIQARFMSYKDSMIIISHVFDPRNAFLLYAPALFSFDFKAGRRLMWVIVLVEWSNHLLKWLFQGERPYWWVHETEIYNVTGKVAPSLQQFPITCETGPGNPSGHAQSTSAVWYVIIHTILQKNDIKRIYRFGLVSKTCWLVYFLIMTAIGISRIFIAAHFSHQCLLGMMLGWTIAVLVENISQVRLNTFQYSAITAGMMASAGLVYVFLEATGANPMWTISKALKWCVDQDYIHLDTTPLYSMMRYCGLLLGMGFGFNSSYYKNPHIECTLEKRLLDAILSIAISLLFQDIAIYKHSLVLFYIQAFVLHTLQAYLVIAVIPSGTNFIWMFKRKNS